MRRRFDVRVPRARVPGKSVRASRPFRAMIARPKISRNEWNTAEIGAFEVGHVALFRRPVARVLERGRAAREYVHGPDGRVRDGRRGLGEEGRRAALVDALGHAVVHVIRDGGGAEPRAAGRARVAPAPLDAPQARHAAGLGDLHGRRRPRARERRPRADLDAHGLAEERRRAHVLRRVGLAEQPHERLGRGPGVAGAHGRRRDVEAVLRSHRHGARRLRRRRDGRPHGAAGRLIPSATGRLVSAAGRLLFRRLVVVGHHRRALK